MIEAASDGWWYTAMLPSRQRVVAYLTDADLAPPGLATRKSFISIVTGTRYVRACLAAHGYRLQMIPKATPANTSRLDCTTGDGWLAIGDAALSFDPLSSQGILTSLHTGMKAGEALHDCLSGNSDAIADYDHHLSTIYDAYLRNRSMYYMMEQRWRERPFWQRRQPLKHDGGGSGEG